jgi:hypothetical protein
MKKNLFALAFILFAFAAAAQENDLPVRTAYKMKMAMDTTNYFQMDVKADPYIFPDRSLQIYPGEKLFIEVKNKGKKIVEIKNVKENLNPEKTLIIEFVQETKGREHTMMMLTVTNPFKYTLNYKCLIYLLKFDKWTETSVIPVRPGLSSIETWPDLIATMALKEFRFR